MDHVPYSLAFQKERMISWTLVESLGPSDFDFDLAHISARLIQLSEAEFSPAFHGLSLTLDGCACRIDMKTPGQKFGGIFAPRTHGITTTATP
jgi:hypothetical protein